MCESPPSASPPSQSARAHYHRRRRRRRCCCCCCCIQHSARQPPPPSPPPPPRTHARTHPEKHASVRACWCRWTSVCLCVRVRVCVFACDRVFAAHACIWVRCECVWLCKVTRRQRQHASSRGGGQRNIEPNTVGRLSAAATTTGHTLGHTHTHTNQHTELCWTPSDSSGKWGPKIPSRRASATRTRSNEVCVLCVGDLGTEGEKKENWGRGWGTCVAPATTRGG